MDSLNISVVFFLVIAVLVFFAYLNTQAKKKLEEAKKKFEEELLRREKIRVEEILTHQSEWGEETCKKLVQKSIAIKMTEEMVKLSLGTPKEIDEKEITERNEKFRWVYGTPRQGATYIWFKDGIVTKIKQ